MYLEASGLYGVCLPVMTFEISRNQAEGYDAMVLPVVLGSAGTLFKCLNRATKKRTFPMSEQTNTRQASIIQHTQSTGPFVPTTILGKTKANLRSRGMDKRQISSLPTPR
jgi:hypothetical protein